MAGNRLKSMIWMGLTGGIGCGKSTVLKIFEELGCGIESADSIVSTLYKDASVLEEITKALDLQSFRNSEDLKGQISKKVFENKNNLELLESILHPKVRKKALESKAKLEKKGFKISFYEIPLLFEKNLEDQFYKTVCVGANSSVQLERIKKRNPNWSEQEIQNRINSQLSVEEKKKRADFYIDNSGDLKQLKEACDLLLSRVTAS